VPSGLAQASRKAEGKGRSAVSLAGINALKLNKGYCIAAGDWDAADKTPTRLGNETRPVYLAIEQNGVLMPMVRQARYAWENSFVRVDDFRIDGLAPEWRTRFHSSIQKLQQTIPLLSEAAGGILLPLIVEGDGWIGWCQKDGKPQQVRYDHELGLLL
jgi:CRISPR-associated endonuclease/helicase Cas3